MKLGIAKFSDLHEGLRLISARGTPGHIAKIYKSGDLDMILVEWDNGHVSLGPWDDGEGPWLWKNVDIVR